MRTRTRLLMAGILVVVLAPGCGQRSEPPAEPPPPPVQPAKLSPKVDDVDVLIRTIERDTRDPSGDDAALKALEDDVKGLDAELKGIRGNALAAMADEEDVDKLIKSLKAASSGRNKDGEKKAAAPAKSPEKGIVPSDADAVERIKKLGGRVGRDAKLPGDPVVYVDLTKTKATDDDLAVLEGFRELRRLNLLGVKITDAGLAPIKDLTSLEELTISCNTNITDAGLAHLKGLTNMDWLSLSATKVTDAGLVHFKGMRKLSWLDLNFTNITDAGLAHLKGLRILRKLNLSSTGIGDAGLIHLKGLTKLEQLELADTNVTSAGLVHLVGLGELRHLSLIAYHMKPHPSVLAIFPNAGASPRIDDEGLKHLKGLRKLEWLLLDGNNITDAGLAHLAGFTEMRNLSVKDTKVTQAGLDQLTRRQAVAKANKKPPNAVDEVIATDEAGADRDRRTARSVQLPPHFDQLDLTNEQLDKMQRIAAPYDAKIAELKRKMAAARRVRIGATSIILAARNAINKVSAQRTQALEAVLTDDQRDKLRQLRGE